MNKTSLVEELRSRIKDLDSLLAFIRRKPELKVSGSLLCSKRKGGFEYFIVHEDGSRQYLGDDKHELVVLLAKKKHYQKMIDVAERERGQLVRCLKILESKGALSDIDKVYPSLHEGIRKICGPFTITDDGYVSKWLKKYNYLRDRQELNGQNRTLKGEYVKSKSEIIIADRLTYYGVPYVYEVTTASDPFFNMSKPDFLILNKRTKAEFFWEHLGKMGDPQYAARNQIKMEQFAKQGIIMGKNLIVSFECGERPLSTEYVDSIIKQLLL